MFLGIMLLLLGVVVFIAILEGLLGKGIHQIGCSRAIIWFILSIFLFVLGMGMIQGNRQPLTPAAPTTTQPAPSTQPNSTTKPGIHTRSTRTALVFVD